MKNFKKSCLTLVSFAALFVCASSLAAVKSRTVEIDVVENGESIGKKVVVTCRSKNEKREIFKKKDALMWCDTAFPEMCEKFKSKLGESVCSSSYRNKLASSQKAASSEQAASSQQPASSQPADEKVDQTEELKAELMEIEQKRIDIADKVLELKRRELELQKTLS